MLQKETYEWVDSWCDFADHDDLPRIILIGDSITRGYQSMVRETLRGRCYVDFLATSYSMDNPLYWDMLQSFLANSHYDLIHYNFGLHGQQLDSTAYENGLGKVNQLVPKGCALVFATSTEPYSVSPENKLYQIWAPLVKERNEVMLRFALKNLIPLDDLHQVSLALSSEERAGDCIHFAEAGNKKLAKEVVASIEKHLFFLK